MLVKNIVSVLRLDPQCCRVDRALHGPFSHTTFRPIKLAEKIALVLV